MSTVFSRSCDAPGAGYTGPGRRRGGATFLTPPPPAAPDRLAGLAAEGQGGGARGRSPRARGRGRRGRGGGPVEVRAPLAPGNLEPGAPRARGPAAFMSDIVGRPTGRRTRGSGRCSPGRARGRAKNARERARAPRGRWGRVRPGGSARRPRGDPLVIGRPARSPVFRLTEGRGRGSQGLGQNSDHEGLGLPVTV